MNAQLLLLLALVGPFCAFTHASPTELPTGLDVGTTGSGATSTTAATEASNQKLTDVTGPPATKPTATPVDVTPDDVTKAAPPFVMVSTEEAIVTTESPVASATVAEDPLITGPPAVETTAPTVQAETESTLEAKAAAEAETADEVVIEGKTEGALSSGQIVGIVIGALLAVVFVTAVVIAVVRRMGKYSP